MRPEIQCEYCKHLQKGVKCKAFPNGIPEEIRLNKHDHKYPYKGDHGIQFEPIDSRFANIKVESWF